MSNYGREREKREKKRPNCKFRGILGFRGQGWVHDCPLTSGSMLDNASKREPQPEPCRGCGLLTGTCLLTESNSVFKCILLLSVKDFTRGETNSIGKV